MILDRIGLKAEVDQAERDRLDKLLDGIAAAWLLARSDDLLPDGGDPGKHPAH